MKKNIRRQQGINRRRVYSWQRRVNCIVNTYLDQRREHLLDRAYDHDPRTNTNVEISKI